ncbi:MAG: CapA family protein [Pseudomonadota bacterium]
MNGSLMMQDNFTVFLAGDAIVTLPWSHVHEPEFLALVDQMRKADVTVINLETVVHSFRGFAQADSGGTWTASPPAIAKELAWSGVDMVSHANNHAFDYGTDGVLETHELINAAGIVISGSGKDLRAARAPGWTSVKGRKIAHLSVTATFVPYGRASRSRPDLRGRPGVNPLTLTDQTNIGIPAWLKTVMRRVDGVLGNDQTKYERRRFVRFGRRFEVAGQFSLERGRRPDKDERTENIQAVKRAAGQSDLTVVSVHTHDETQWLHAYVSDVLAAGADIVHVHGVHALRGIQISDGRPVFFGLGNFVFQTAQIKPLPAEAYEAVGLDDTTTPADILEATRPWAQSFRREIFEGCATLLTYAEDRLETIELFPLDLQFGAGLDDLGRPQLAEPELGRRIIEEVRLQSARFGTRVLYDDVTNTGRIDVL